jgi:hypothetical protein
MVKDYFNSKELFVKAVQGTGAKGSQLPGYPRGL